MTTDLQTLALLERIESRVVAAQLLAAGTSAWAPLRRLAIDVRNEITAGYRAVEAFEAACAAKAVDDWFAAATPEMESA